MRLLKMPNIDSITNTGHTVYCMCISPISQEAWAVLGHLIVRTISKKHNIRKARPKKSHDSPRLPPAVQQLGVGGGGGEGGVGVRGWTQPPQPLANNSIPPNAQSGLQ